MEILITRWALESYLKLIEQHAFSRKEFEEKIRPDVLLLKTFPNNEKFGNGKFWSIATCGDRIIDNGFKMKWHNLGNGRIQLRLAIALLSGKAFLCHGYVKTDEKIDKKEMIKLKIRIQNIRETKYEIAGVL